MIDLAQILANTLSGVIQNSAWFILFYFGFRMIAKEIRIGVRNIPKWIEQYYKLQNQQNRIMWAKGNPKKV